MNVSTQAAATRAVSSAARLVELGDRLDRLERGEPSTPHDVQRARTQAISQAQAVTAARERLIITQSSAVARHLEYAERLEAVGQPETAARHREAARRCEAAVQRHRTMEQPSSGRAERSDIQTPARVAVPQTPPQTAGGSAAMDLLKETLIAQFLWSGPMAAPDVARRRGWCEAIVATTGEPDFTGWLHAVCVVAASVLPSVRGVAATITAGGAAEMTAASDDWTARVQELELVVGEGPSVEAVTHNREVVVEDLASAPSRWPGYEGVTSDQRVRGVCAVPVRLQGRCAGSLTLFGHSRVDAARLVDGAAAFADIAAAATVADVEAIRLGDQSRHSRFTVHVASGALAARLDITPREAETRIRAYAFSTGLGLLDVAELVLGGGADVG